MNWKLARVRDIRSQTNLAIEMAPTWFIKYKHKNITKTKDMRLIKQNWVNAL